MKYASKTTFYLNNLKILRPKVTKNLKNSHTESQLDHLEIYFFDRSTSM